MSDLSRRLLLAADADRRGIERELHDGLQQELVAIVVRLQLARKLVDSDPAGAATLLDEIRADTQAALDATRELGLRIYPPLLDAAGMRAALRAAAPQAAIEVELGEGDACPEEVAACVYFSCLELLPGASAVGVRADAGSIVFEVATEEEPDVTRVADRVEALGGRLETSPGRVSGTIPMP